MRRLSGANDVTLALEEPNVAVPSGHALGPIWAALGVTEGSDLPEATEGLRQGVVVD